MSALTDTSKIKKDDPADPEKCMVYYYNKLINSKNINEICSECKKGSRGCVQCKKELIANMQEFLKPIKERAKKYEEDEKLVDEILLKCTNKAQFFNNLPEAPRMDGAYELLETLQRQGIQIILVTGSGQRSLLNRLNNNYPNIQETIVLRFAFFLTRSLSVSNDFSSLLFFFGSTITRPLNFSFLRTTYLQQNFR